MQSAAFGHSQLLLVLVLLLVLLLLLLLFTPTIVWERPKLLR